MITEEIQQVDIKFFVNEEFLESRISLKLFSGATDYWSLTNEQVYDLLEKLSVRSSRCYPEKLDPIIKQKLLKYRRNRVAIAPIEDL